MKYLSGNSFSEPVSSQNVSDDDWKKMFGPKYKMSCSKCSNNTFINSNNAWHCKRCGSAVIIVEDKDE